MAIKVFMYYFECKNCSTKIKLPDNPSRLPDSFELKCSNGHTNIYKKDDVKSSELGVKATYEEQK